MRRHVSVPPFSVLFLPEFPLSNDRKTIFRSICKSAYVFLKTLLCLFMPINEWVYDILKIDGRCRKERQTVFADMRIFSIIII